MAILWYDGADYLSTSQISLVYDFISSTTQVSTLAARTGTNGYIVAGGSGTMRKNLGLNSVTLVGGAAVKASSAWTNLIGILGFWDNGTQQTTLRIDGLGRLFFTRGAIGSPILSGPSVVQIPQQQFHYIEAKVTFDNSAGSVAAWVDGIQVLNTTGLDTTATSNNFANQFSIGNLDINTGGGNIYYDDIYCLDTTGSAPWNDRLGDVAVVTQMPSASGSFAQWTPTPAGANLNYARVNEIPPDSDTTRVSAAATGLRDSYVYPSFPPTGLTNIQNILAAAPMAFSETDTAGTGNIQLVARQAGVDLFSSAIPLGVGYRYSTSPYFVMPTDVNGNPWTTANLNATEFGIYRSS